jgi:succinate dehydrogenase flavin-adding protein (antitoxin of CptAB toxin-antitoxin module)
MIETEFRKKLLYRSMHRGCKETDLLLGRFAEKYIHDMTFDELKEWDLILNQSDSDIVSWLLKQTEVPKALQSDIMRRLLL